ncbi:MAG: hypothetical protein Q9170_003969 [Blastenia crenularia]
MNSGSCLCGQCTVQITADPKLKALCHCLDCRKITGSTYSTNVLIPNDACTLVSGTPKQYTKGTNKGNQITSFFCGDCGTTIWRESTGKDFEVSWSFSFEGCGG